MSEETSSAPNLQADVERISRSLEAFNRRDVAAALAHFADDGEWLPSPTNPERRLYRGKEQVGAYLEELLASFKEFHFEIREALPCPHDRVYVAAEATLLGTASEIPLRLPIFHVFHVREGRTTRAEAFLEEGQARKAAGLDA